jgi:hypothetical protein
MGLPGRRVTQGASSDELADRFMAARKRLLETLVATGKAFLQIGPEGRELSESERVELRTRLIADARCLRELDHERSLISEMAPQERRLDIRPAISLVRRLDRSMILALSEDPDLRRRSGATSDHAHIIDQTLRDLGLRS